MTCATVVEEGLLGMAEQLGAWRDQGLGLVGVRVLWEVGGHHRVKIRRRIGAREGHLMAWNHRHHWVRLLETPIIGHSSRRMLMHIHCHLVLLKQLIQQHLLLLLFPSHIL